MYRSTLPSAVPGVSRDEVCGVAQGWIAVPGDRIIPGVVGNVISVVEVTSPGNLARKLGRVTLA